MDLSAISIFLIVGALAGTAAGLLGIGGGIIYVPVLLFYLADRYTPIAYLPVIAVSTSLLIIMVSSLNALYGHWRNGNVAKKHDFFKLFLGGVIGAIPASLLLSRINAGQFVYLLGVFQLLMGIKILLPKKSPSQSQQERKERNRHLLIGITSGSFSAFFGVGGGVITVPLLHLWEDYPMAKAIGTSTGFMSLIALVSFISYYIQRGSEIIGTPGMVGPLYLPAFLAIIPGAFLFAGFGANLAAKVNNTLLVRLFGGILILIALRNFFS